ncbi:MAG: ABC transporter substrate-binding protein [Chloroflexi bacterium]|nr:ABC transporter substrate-binding protein [Chloroflexota bacterium]
MQTRKVLATASCLTVLWLLLASCSSVAAPPPASKSTALLPPALTPAPREEQPKYGGVLRRWGRLDAPGFDPHHETAYDTVQVIALAYEGLLEYDPLKQEEIAAGLAESWELSKDGKAYTLKLRQGVRWHDGKPFTAEDVKFSLERIKDPPRGVRSGFKDFLEAVERVQIEDARTVRLVLKRSSAILLPALAIPNHSIVPRHIVEEKGQTVLSSQILGTGPFKVKDIARGSRYEFRKNDDYFRSGRPYLHGVSILIIPDRATMAAAMATRRLDMLLADVDRASADRIASQNPQTKVVTYPSFIYTALIFDVKGKPFDDVRVRRAVNLAIDREAAIKTVAGGWGEIGGFTKPSFWALPKEELLKRPEFGGITIEERRTQARRLLDEAGIPPGFKLEWPHRNDGLHMKWAIFVRDQLERIGFEAKNIPMDNVAAQANLYGAERLKYPFKSWRLSVRLVDPTAVIADVALPGGQFYNRYDNPRVKELWQEQETEVDAQKRRALAWQIERIMLDDVVLGIGYFEMDAAVYGPEVRNYVVHTSARFTSALSAREVWLAR